MSHYFFCILSIFFVKVIVAQTNVPDRKVRQKEYKVKKLQNLIAEVMETTYFPFFLQAESWSKEPNKNGPVVFTAALMNDLSKYTLRIGYIP